MFHPERPTDVRERLGIPAGAPVLFSPRSFTQPYYNLDVIIESCRDVMAERPDVHVVFSGYEGDQTPFVARARAAGLDRNTHFVGRIPHDEFADYLVASDVFLSVPSVDATAVSLLEAMACGTAIVVSALPSSMEWIEDGVTGRVVQPRDVPGLTGAIGDLLSDPGLRRRCGEAALALARARAGVDDNFRRAELLYEWLVTGEGPAADLADVALEIP